MKTASLTYPSHTLTYIDIAPLAARYAVLAQAILAMVISGRLRESLRLTHKVIRLVRSLTRLEAHNSHLGRKLDMLSCGPWRERVLRELGGLRKLKLWDAAKARIETRSAANPRSVKDETPSWLHTVERIAESERLKARVRMCGRATAHPLIFRDRYKMDFDGQFRLAPLPRGERAARQIKVYTQNTIVDYNWNNIPFAKTEGFGPARVWPAEFYTAMRLEAEMLQSNASLSFPRKRGSNDKHRPKRIDPRSSYLPRKQQDEGDKSECKGNKIETLPLKQILSPKVYQDFFGSLAG